MNHRVTKDTVTDTCSTLEQYSRTGAVLTLYVTVVLSCCESHRLPLTVTHLVSCVLTVCHLQTATNAVPWAHQPLYKPVVCGAMCLRLWLSLNTSSCGAWDMGVFQFAKNQLSSQPVTDLLRKKFTLHCLQYLLPSRPSRLTIPRNKRESRQPITYKVAAMKDDERGQTNVFACPTYLQSNKLPPCIAPLTIPQSVVASGPSQIS
jgi:hypothetical protein